MASRSIIPFITRTTRRTWQQALDLRAWAALGLALLITGSAGLFIVHLQTRAVDDNERSLSGLATVLADQADRSLQAIELVQDAVLAEFRTAQVTTAEHYAETASKLTMHMALQTWIAALPQANAITLVDRAGTLLNFSRYWPIPNVNIADRDYFKVLSSDRNLQRYVGRPVQNRGDGAWTIYIARKVATPAGAFLGLILGAVELGYFEDLYAQISPADDAVVSLFRNDGMLLVRHPRRDGTIGRIFPGAGAALIASRNMPGDVLRTVSPIDGQDRLIAAHALKNYPLVLSVSRTAEACLAAWRQQAAIVGTGAILLDLGLLGLVLIGRRQTRAQEQLAQAEAARAAAEARERSERDRRVQDARFGIALDNMVQGLCLFDRDGTLIVMNARYAQMYAVPDDLRRPGTALHALLDHLGVPQRGLGPVASQALVTACERTAAHGHAVALTCDFADGRAVDVVHAPIPGGGWLCTHEDVTERRRSEARMAHMARHDALTGLPNRLVLKERMDAALGRRDGGGPATVLCLDLDGFKVINDTYGHPVGDALLCAVAARFVDRVAQDDLVARLGGDEFAVVQGTPGPPADAARLARRLVEALEAPIMVNGHTLAIGTSIGIAVAEGTSGTAATLLRQADIALYQAKAAGRGTWRFFDPAMDVEIQRRRQLGTDLRRALAEGQFELHYQPIVGAHSQALHGFEALLRWRHPQHGPVSPEEFIPLAEEIGLIKPLGAWVLATACTAAARWPEPVRIAVNLSPLQFIGEGLGADVRAALAVSGLSPDRLELEITESVLLQDNAANLALLREFRAAGVRIAMDDFGTGYSSLSYLHRFPFDKLKIDQCFVRSLARDGGSVAILRAMIWLGKALKIDVLAEGVETPEQAQILREEGCHELQGYLFGRPAPVSGLAAILALTSDSLRALGPAPDRDAEPGVAA
ncbi:EAL domain-containing protein [Methylobacterium sp. NEAU K]|uniref:bifunctional diguanylate cyclase/phosphodiesterase n=1 Tax=Methylobacterium sp. NEAU K TaxID=3064946 RepID=UPI002732F78E|nr:EAL domain-containing protein [Methylobacterium sp. NEAU K]MDP4003894.1 EAL domain-containing protein [Methylobacterium sp. NEAU K]